MRKILLVSLFLLLPSYAMAQEPAALKATPEAKPKAEEKKAPPDTFTIPEVRQDKARLLSKDLLIIEMQLRELTRLYKEQEAQQRQLAEKLTAEMASAMRAVGIEEKDFDKYEMNRDTLIITKKKTEETAKKP